MDELLEKAMARREQLRKELASIENFIAEYQRIRSMDPAPTRTGTQMTLWSPELRRVSKAAEVAKMMDAAEKMIVEARRPLTRSELLEGLEGAGFKVEGSDKSKVLGTNLWRSKRFHNLSGAGYWPKNTPVPVDFNQLARRPNALNG
ncbi:hypothetical protein [Rhizorhabdus sp.]|uniref:hypothetical protein n=1 Tax=Rhizorhabdus sp. TaxID=1968843 RepID=UPI0019B66C22|nr:hypothetical protein [Rhizorhabdus sp.]MBD3762501.1 hypothetical protein [Rhizorhabdus sp.]